jgi:hypothetical protein
MAEIDAQLRRHVAEVIAPRRPLILIGAVRMASSSARDTAPRT